MTNPTACREAFEKWALSNFLDITWIEPIPPMINESHYRDNSVMQMWLAYQDAWKARETEGEAVSGDHEITVEVIGYAKEGEDGPYIEWLPEGGIHDLPVGLPVFAIEGRLDIEDGWTSLYTHPSATSAEVERDAARYRWLRDHSEPGACAFYLSVGMALHGVRFEPKTVDNFIDSAMTAKDGE